MTMDTLSTTPAGPLPEVLDLLIWDCDHAGRPMIEAWRAALLARPDAASEGVQRAVAVCDEYLAPEGSPEGKAAAERAWPGEGA